MFLQVQNSFLQKLHILFNGKLSLIAKACGLEQSHIIICGFPRSGTSLLYNMMSATLCGYKFTEFEKYSIHYLHKLGNYITKAPMDVLHVKYLDSLNSNGKKLVVLLVVRDIRDIITSRHPIFTDEFFIGYDHSWWPQDQKFTEWGYDAPGILEIHSAMIEAIHFPYSMLVRYEDLVKHPDIVQRNIRDMFDLNFCSNFHGYHQKSEKHAYRYEGEFAAKDQSLVREGKQVTGERVARWKKDKQQVARVKQQFAMCSELFGILEYYGYETDSSWFEGL